MITDEEYKEIEDIIREIMSGELENGFEDSVLRDIFGTSFKDEIFMNFPLKEIVEKMKEYEGGVDVGDVVRVPSNHSGVVTYRNDYSESIGVVFSDGSCGRFKISEVTKLEQKFPEISDILEELTIIDKKLAHERLINER